MTNLLDKIKNRLEFSKKGGTTATGQPVTDIDLTPTTSSVREQTEKHAVFTFGRFNPPTQEGHGKLIKKVQDTAAAKGASHTIFASQSQDSKKNPLPYVEKTRFMSKMFPGANIHKSHTVKTILDAARHIAAQGTTHATLVVGSDRVDEFHNLLSKYNKHPDSPDYDPTKHFYIPHLNVISAGNRDPDAEGSEGMSASKLRAHAVSGNFKAFAAGTHPSVAKPMYDSVRAHMGINEQTLSPVEKMSLKIRAGAEKERKTAQSAAAKKIKQARRVDHESEHYAKKYVTPHAPATMPSSMALNPYEETRYIIPNVRDEMAPGDKPVDIGYDKDLESKDITKQLRRRQGMKRFKQVMDEDAYDPGSSVPTPVNIMIPSIKIKPKKSKADYSDVATTSEEVDNEGGMARNELQTAERGIKNIKTKIKSPNTKLPAWVQSKISKAADHIDTVSDYMSGDHESVSEEICETTNSGLAAKASKSGISISTLRKVYRRGVAAWNSGHRPGTTPQQWGMARVNSYIGKDKGTYGGADKDLHEEELIEVAKDKDTGLPKNYMSGIKSKSIKKARAAHFAKTSKMSDRDPASYEPAPGDTTAKTKPSKHTLKYHQMYGENVDEEILEACWKNYKQVGVKKKGNRIVPNCVPEDVINEEHKVGDTVSIDNPGHFSHKKSGKILNIVGNNARIKYGSEWHPETPVWVQHTTFVPVSTLKKHQTEEQVKEEGMLGDVSIGDKPTAYPNVSTPTPSVVARPQQRLKNKGAVNTTPYKEQEPS